MGLKEWFVDRGIERMSREEKESMMNKMMDKFFESMIQDEKKEMMTTMMPKVMDKMFEQMSSEDMMVMMSQMMRSRGVERPEKNDETVSQMTLKMMKECM